MWLGETNTRSMCMHAHGRRGVSGWRVGQKGLMGLREGRSVCARQRTCRESEDKQGRVVCA